VRTIYTSQTEVGDQLLIYPPDKMQEYLKESQTKVTRAVASP